jgi:hypothetical protein
MELKIGTTIKRKYYDFQEVTIVNITNDHIIIQDSGGRHFIRKEIVNEFFEPVRKKITKKEK